MPRVMVGKYARNPKNVILSSKSRLLSLKLLLRSLILRTGILWAYLFTNFNYINMGNPNFFYRLVFCSLCLLLVWAAQPQTAYAQQATAADTTAVNGSAADEAATATESPKGGKIPITQNDYANQEIEMADAWRANGKIYVVVAVVVSLLAGLVFFLVFLERRISKLESELEG